jgi:chemotaxis signal transduction protein
VGGGIVRLLVFAINDTLFGIDINNTEFLEDYEHINIVSIPSDREYILGIGIIRGEIIPLIDIANVLGIEDSNYDKVVVVRIKNKTGKEGYVGLVTGKVHGIFIIEEEQIRESSFEFSNVTNHYVLYKNEEVIQILDIAKFLGKLNIGLWSENDFEIIPEHVVGMEYEKTIPLSSINN